MWSRCHFREFLFQFSIVASSDCRRAFCSGVSLMSPWNKSSSSTYSCSSTVGKSNRLFKLFFFLLGRWGCDMYIYMTCLCSPELLLTCCCVKSACVIMPPPVTVNTSDVIVGSSEWHHVYLVDRRGRSPWTNKVNKIVKQLLTFTLFHRCFRYNTIIQLFVSEGAWLKVLIDLLSDSLDNMLFNSKIISDVSSLPSLFVEATKWERGQLIIGEGHSFSCQFCLLQVYKSFLYLFQIYSFFLTSTLDQSLKNIPLPHCTLRCWYKDSPYYYTINVKNTSAGSLIQSLQMA